MPILNHEHAWSWAPYWENGPDRRLFVCMADECDATMPLVDAEDRINKVERVMWAYRQGTVEAGIEVMAWVRGWTREQIGEEAFDRMQAEWDKQIQRQRGESDERD